MKKFCIIGNPVNHSKSPDIFSYIFDTLNINAKYYAKEILDNDAFNEFIIKNKSTYSGFNITAPFKKQAYKIVDQIHSSACELNSVNCIENKNDKLVGYNTDAYGFEMMLKNRPEDLKNKIFLILGNGAVAQTVCSVLCDNYVNEIYILGRSVVNVKKFIQNINEIKLSSNIIEGYSYKKNRSYIIINCLPLNIDEKSTDNILSYIPISNIELVIDLNYMDSKLTEKFKLLNYNMCSGYEMLLFQAIKSFEIWFKNKPNKIEYNAIKKHIINE